MVRFRWFAIVRTQATFAVPLVILIGVLVVVGMERTSADTPDAIPARKPAPRGQPAQDKPQAAPTPTLPKRAHTDHRPVVVLLDVPGEVDRVSGAKNSLWRKQLKVFAPSYRIVTLPLPRSFATGDEESNRNLADIIAESLQARGVDRFGLAAYKADGGAAIELAARANAGVEFLILVDVVPRTEKSSSGGPGFQAVNDRLESTSQIDQGDRVVDPVDQLTMPVLIFFRADLLEVRSARKFLAATGFDMAEQVRVHRIASEHPILRTAADDINRKIAAFLNDMASGRAIVKRQRVELPSGLSYVESYVGEGPPPTAGQTLALRWRMRLNDRTDVTPCGGFLLPRTIVFDESLLPGLYEGLSTMRVGGKRKLFIPAKLGYNGEGDGKRIPPGAALTVDVVLLKASDAPLLSSKPSWNRDAEKAVNEHVRIVERKTGEGVQVRTESIVTFGYKLWSDAGALVRSTYPDRPKRGVLRDINNEAKVWLPGMLGMRPGGERLIIGNAEYAFGGKFLPGICAEDDIVFRVRVLKVEPLGSKPILTPVGEDQYTQLNPDLKYFDIKVGKGDLPDKDSAIAVHYAFWPYKYKNNPDSCLDSSRMRRQPFVIPLAQCPPSWRKCLPSMEVGGHRQMKYRYDGVERAGIVKGDWVIYEIELLAVLDPQQYEKWRKGPRSRFAWEDD